ncbi:hypothetical protein O59_004280 [Cellvibrio sp. BR]|uniref:winged helix-turn-helix transcriptional regulator n=1 Tax=Cellvibrio sp. BR TaxID=1134474 RepID=UPI0002600C74|nr:winged helix-turn-helix transcriptional regulator [Cellvibrio sp. BR]EIK42962.1 hypothetical protein O59_004280 [Cellvibrio sp. BR]
MSQGQNSSNLRDKNEQLILLLMREHQQLSKADIAQLTGLTYPAVARIVETLESKCLIQKKGIQKKPRGKPTAQYEIRANGRLAIGIEIRENIFLIAVINFHGTILVIQEYPVHQQTNLTLADQIYHQVVELVKCLKLEQQRALIGIGLIDSGDEIICVREIKARLSQRLKNQNDQSLYKLVLVIVPAGITAAAAEIIKNPTSIKKDSLYIQIDLDIDGCFIFANEINLHRPVEKKFLGSMPIAFAAHSRTEVTQYNSLNEQSSLASLCRHLGVASTLELMHFNYQAQNPATNQIISAWIQNAASALAFSIETSASLHHLDEIIIVSSMPKTWLFTLIDNVKSQASTLLRNRIRSGLTGDETAIIGSAALLLIGDSHRG